MAAFHRPEDALEAAVEIQKRFQKGEELEVPLALRISLHRGICLAVRLQANIDYFGDAVNYAAKMQSVTGAGEIVMSKPFFSQPDIAERCAALGLDPVETEFSLYGSEDGENDRVMLASLRQ